MASNSSMKRMDGWSLLLGQSEGVCDQLGSVSNKHLDKLRSSELQETRLGLGSAGAGHQGLAGTWRANEVDKSGGKVKSDKHFSEIMFLATFLCVSWEVRQPR